MLAMSIGAIAGLGTNYIQSLLGSSNSTSGTTNNSTNVSSLSALTDNSQLSPFAQLMNTLQQLQQSNPTQYKQVTQDIATNLQKAATTAQSEGNTSLAAQLNQLSTDFTNASQSGQLPNVADLAQATGAGHHHGHHHHHASSDATSQALSAFQTSSTQSDSLNPMSIIASTLTTDGITSSSS